MEKTNKEHHLGIKREIPFYGADKGNWGLWWSFSECILCERIVSPAIHKAWADAFICGAFFVHSNCQNTMQKLLESKLSKCKVCRSQWSISKETSDKGPVVGWISLWQYHLCRQLGHFFCQNPMQNASVPRAFVRPLLNYLTYGTSAEGPKDISVQKVFEHTHDHNLLCTQMNKISWTSDCGSPLIEIETFRG